MSYVFSKKKLDKVPFSFIQFGIYEQTKSILNPENTYSPITNAICGGVAGGVAAYVTTPLDVIKTVLNTQEGLTSGACSPCSAGNQEIIKEQIRQHKLNKSSILEG